MLTIRATTGEFNLIEASKEAIAGKPRVSFFIKRGSGDGDKIDTKTEIEKSFLG